MKRRIVSVILALALLLPLCPAGVLSFPANAATSGTSRDCTWELEGTVLTIRGNESGRMENYTSSPAPWGNEITSVIIEEGVSIIGTAAFEGCTALTEVKLPSTIISIGPRVFQNCSSLLSIEIPEGVSYLGSNIFSGCSSLTSIVIPEGETTIRDNAFDGCSSLTSVKIPEGIRTIGDYAFRGCSALTEIALPSALTSIDSYAFDGCSSLTSVEIPEGVSYLGSNIFSGCSSLTSIVIPEGETTIKDNAFDGCSSLTSVEIPEGVKTIGSYAFRGCSALTEIALPSTLTSILGFAFDGCSSLTSVEIPEGVKTIGNSAFRGCSALTEIVLPSTLTSISNYAFYQCSELSSIVYGGSEAKKDKITISSTGNTNLLNGKWSYAEVTIGEHAYSSPTDTQCNDCDHIRTLPEYDECGVSGGVFWYRKGTTLTVLGCGSMGNYNPSTPAPWGTEITSVTMKEGVKNVGLYAFYGCSSLTSVEIPEGVKTIGINAFRGCSALTEIVLPSTLTSIGSYAFYGCSSLTSVEIPEGVKTIGNDAFRGCSALTEIALPSTLTSIGSYAFYQCSKLSSIVYGGSEAKKDKITISSTGNTKLLNEKWSYAEVTIGEHAYSSPTDTQCNDCDHIRTLPEYDECGVSGGVFWYRKGTALTILGSGSMGSYTSSNVTSPTVAPWGTEIISVTVEEGVKTVGTYAFYQCSSLSDVSLPSTLTTIGNGAFRECSSLSEITLPSALTSIKTYAFRSCRALTSVVMPRSVTAIHNYAFDGCSRLSSVVFIGSKEEKEKIDIADSGNSCLLNAKWTVLFKVEEHYYSDAEDTQCNDCDHIRTLPEYDECGVSGEVFWYRKGTALTILGSGSMGNYSGTTLPWGTEITSVTVEEGVSTIGSYAFNGCHSLCSVTLPSTLKSIGISAFQECRGLLSIAIPDGVSSIGSWAFYACFGLSSVEIPEGVTTIGSDAFLACSLDSLSVSEKNEKYYSSGNCVIERSTNKLILGCDGSVIPEGVTSIGSYAFENCTNLKEITLPSTLTTIEDYAFKDCQALASVAISEGLTTVGIGVFHGCSSLACVTVDEDNQVYYSSGNCLIERETQRLVVGGNTAIIPEGVRTIAEYAFTFRDRVFDSINIPLSVTTVENGAFWYAYIDDVYYEGGLQSKNKISIGNSNPAFETAQWHYNSCMKNPDTWEHAFDDYHDTECETCGKTRPGAPKLASALRYQITLEETEGFEYSTDGITWQQSPVFEGLIPGTEYTFYQREIAAEEGEDHLISGAAVYTTETALVIRSYPDKMTYRLWEQVDLTGLNVVYYTTETDAVEVPVEQLTVSSWDPQTLDNKVTLTCAEYGNACVSFEVTITIPELKIGEVENVELNSEKSYDYFRFIPDEDGCYAFFSSSTGDTFGYILDSDLNQLVSDDDSGAGSNFKVKYLMKAGETYLLKVCFLHENTTGSFRVAVEKTKCVTGLEIVSLPDRTEYVKEYVYGNLNYDGLEMKVTWSDGSTQIWSPEDGWSLGEESIIPGEWNAEQSGEVVLQCGEASAKFSISIIENPVEKIEINSAPSKEYIFGDPKNGSMYGSDYLMALDDVTGFSFTVYYTDGTSKTFTDAQLQKDTMSADTYRVDGYPLDFFYDGAYSEIGKYPVFINYLGKEAEFEFVLKESPVSSVAVTKKPDKVVYSDDFLPDFTGMELTVTYQDGTEKSVTLTEENVTYQWDFLGPWGDMLRYLVDLEGETITLTSMDSVYLAEFWGATCEIKDLVFEAEKEICSVEVGNLSPNCDGMTVTITYEDETAETLTVDLLHYFDAYPQNNETMVDSTVHGMTEKGILEIYSTVYFDENGNVEKYELYLLGTEITVEVDPVKIGDLNDDGLINAMDRVILIRHLAGWEGYEANTFNYAAADLNRDGIVNAMDRVILIRHLAAWEGYETIPMAQ